LRVFHDIHSYLVEKDTAVTTGTFDGIHIGHKKILSRLNEMCHQQALRSVLLTFDPHPRKVLFPDDHGLQLLNTLDEKLELLEATGIDDVIVHPFTKEFSRTTAIYYVRDLLVQKLSMKKLVIGYDHQFGRNREGSIDQLREYAPLYNFDVSEIPAQDIDDVSVSSTKIRKALLAGEVDRASSFLSYDYFVTGSVVEGKKRGAGLGFPTANIQVNSDTKLIPRIGVYAVKVLVGDVFYFGMLNIGHNPTFGSNSTRTMEVNIFDFNQNIYQKNIRVYFMARIRDEKKFNSPEELVSQLNMDKDQALKIVK
jgi:riboflavin kinase / FMN adenylyltransferase